MYGTVLTVLLILIATVAMLVFEFVSIEVAALLCMLALGWSGILETSEVFAGFSSNAVIAMMAVMILGRGIARTGIMDQFSQAVLRRVGTSRSKVIVFMSLSIGILSGFIQNIGAAALFLPGILNISRKGRMPASSLIMPIGFAAILGGTMSMVGSGPLILVNDLLDNAGLAAFGLFSVTPVGILLLLSGIAFFLIFGKYVLPQTAPNDNPLSEQDKLVAALHLPNQIRHYTIPPNSPLIGMTTERSGVWDTYKLHILGIARERDVEYAPWRERIFEAGQELALLGNEEEALRFVAFYQLVEQKKPYPFTDLHDPDSAGFAEVIIPPRSVMVGQTMRQFGLRKRYAVEPVMLFSKGEALSRDFSDHPLLTGDTIIVHGLWEKINDLKTGSDLVVATPFTVRKRDSSKAWIASLCFLGAIGLAMSGAPLSMAFLTGAIVMVLSRVLTIQEAFQAIEWKVVFLIAGLIPLGIAMEKSGAAAFLAERMMALVQGGHPFLIVLAVALISMSFSLFMSNVGAIVVLAPLVMGMAQIAGLDPRPLVLLAAVSTANSFLLPTHQVNALLMPSGGYRNADYFRAGGGMTLIFLTVVIITFYFFYL